MYNPNQVGYLQNPSNAINAINFSLKFLKKEDVIWDLYNTAIATSNLTIIDRLHKLLLTGESLPDSELLSIIDNLTPF